MKKLITVTILLFFTGACGLSDEDRIATAFAATRSAESIVFTAIAATEQAAPASTPTITPTVAPRPTESPSLTEQQIELLSGITILEDDLSSSFTAISPEELDFTESEVRGLMGEEDISVGSIFTFFDESHFQFLFGFTVLLPDRFSRSSFDAEMRQGESFLDIQASIFAGDEITDNRVIPGADNLGDSSIGMTIAARFEDGTPPLRMDTVAFRRGILGAMLFDMYVDGESPTAPILEVAQTLDTKIQNALE